MVRILRLTKLIKLLRILKLNKLVESLQDTFYINMTFVKFLKLLFKVLYIVHLWACLWWMIGKECVDYKQDSWLYYVDYNWDLESADGIVSKYTAGDSIIYMHCGCVTAWLHASHARCSFLLGSDYPHHSGLRGHHSQERCR